MNNVQGEKSSNLDENINTMNINKLLEKSK